MSSDRVKIEILKGADVAEAVSSREMRELTDAFVDASLQPFPLPISETRARVSEVISGLPLGMRLLKLVHSAEQRLREALPGVLSQSEYMERQRGNEQGELFEHIEKAVERGDVVVAKIDGQIAGMIRVEPLEAGEDSFIDGTVCETGKAIVLPAFRERGVYRELRQQMIEHIRGKYGDVPILVGTNSDAVKKLNRADEWQEFGWEEYQKIHGVKESELNPDYLRRSKEAGWTVFIYLPETD